MLHIVPSGQIIIGANRQRREFDEERLSELSDSIQKLGLLHPPVARPDPDNPGSYILVAGERRLRAIHSLAILDIGYTCGQLQVLPGDVAVLLLNELSPEKAIEAELEENIIRVDLSWQERAQAITCLHELRKSQKSGQTQIATAKELAGGTANNHDRGLVSDALIVARHLSDPEVFKAKSQKEALTIIEKKVKAEYRQKLAEQFNDKESPHKFIQGDCRDILAQFPPGTFDVIITDPPYGINADQFGEQSDIGHDYDDSKEYFLELMQEVIPQFARVMKLNAHIYIFCDPRRYETLQDLCTAAGLAVWHVPLIWNKLNGTLPQSEFGPRRTYEMILFARKGNRKVMCVKPDVITLSPEAKVNHGAQKPVGLYTDLLSRSINPGDLILDPFAGSGTIFDAAAIVRCQAVGIEKSQASANLCIERLSKQGVTL